VVARVEGLEVQYTVEKISCRFSRGWTDYRAGETSEELLKRADEALYANKRASKQQGSQNSTSQPTIVPSLL
jgi:PleD family two-component response regulator